MPKPDIDPDVVSAILQRVFRGERSPRFERMRSGGSTQVYRVYRDPGVYYLRFGEEPEDTFAPEVLVHDRLEALGVRVPGVMLFEDAANEIERSIMITTEIAGDALTFSRTDEGDQDQLEILHEAGRDLALVTSISVAGFGFVQRARPWSGTLTGPHVTFTEWFNQTCGDLSAVDTAFSSAEVRLLVEHGASVMDEGQGCPGTLAHGDFDTSHIFAADGRYTGLIDFSEIRGADRWYDLAHFLLQVGGWTPAVAALVRGFAEIQPLRQTDLELIHARAVTLGGSSLQRIRGRNLRGYESVLIRSTRTLLTSKAPAALVG
jgi:aminoglycoside phosphotransferase (APT) family kinase protein